MEVPLSRKDVGRNITDQWNALRSAFADPDKVLLFHLKNHYALIFAVREWTVSCDDVSGVVGEKSEKLGGNYQEELKLEKGGVKVHREIFTARRGQRPAVWIDFSEARETMLAWEGYKIISISRQAGENGQECQETVAKIRTLKSLLEEHFPAQAWHGLLKQGH